MLLIPILIEGIVEVHHIFTHRDIQTIIQMPSLMARSALRGPDGAHGLVRCD